LLAALKAQLAAKPGRGQFNFDRRQVACRTQLDPDPGTRSGTGVSPVCFSQSWYLRHQELTGETPVPLPEAALDRGGAVSGFFPAAVAIGVARRGTAARRCRSAPARCKTAATSLHCPGR